MPSSLDETGKNTPVITSWDIEIQDSWLPGQDPPPKKFQRGQSSYGSEATLRTTKDWVRTVNYAARRANGTLPMNSYQKVIEMRPIAKAQATKTTRYGNGFTRVRENLATQYTAAPWSSIVSSTEVHNKILAAARNQKFNAPVAVVEGQKTADMVTRRATQIFKALRALKRGDLRVALNHLELPRPPRKKEEKWKAAYGKNVADATMNAWLEYRYGWTPLLNEVYGAASALDTLIRDQPAFDVRIVARGRGQRTDPWSTDFQLVTTNFTYPYRTRITYDTKWRAVWIMTPPSDVARPILGLDNPLEVAWELVPFSFVADWFLPIGDFLSGLSLTNQYGHKSYGVGLVSENYMEFQSRKDPGSASQGNYPGGQSRSVARRFIVYGGPPSPGLEFSFKNKLNLTKMMDSVALLWNFSNNIERAGKRL